MKKIIYLTIAITLFISCNKEILDETPRDILSPENLYIDKAGFERGLFGLYNQVRQERGGIDQTGSDADPNNNITNGVMMVGVDNAYSNFSAANNERFYNEWGARNNSTDGYTRKLFEIFYIVINGSNAIINRSTNPKISWTEKEKNQIVAEAKFIRAWAYRHLTFLWGNVPLNLEESTGNTIRTDYERTSVALIRKQMEEDLLWAEVNLADEPINEGRICKAVAQHYLAELYLTIGDNQKAKDKAQAIVNNSMFKLITARYGVNKTKPGTPFTDMFIDGNSNRSNGNTEALWVLQNKYLSTGGDNNIMRRYWVNRYDGIAISGKFPITFSVENGGRGIGRLGPTRFALQLYNNTVDGRVGSSSSDHRGGSVGGVYAWRFFWNMNNPASLPSGSNIGDKVTINYNVDESQSNPRWPCTRKWDWAPADNVQEASNYNNQIYLRLGETYLLLAEAQYKTGDAAGAATTINALRTRANTTSITAADINMNFILDERSRELFTEEHRRYTLLRVRDEQNPAVPAWYTRTLKYNKIASPNIQLRDTLLPIPQTVIDANLTKPMPQNGGY
jgi:hypothetical protein